MEPRPHLTPGKPEPLTTRPQQPHHTAVTHRNTLRHPRPPRRIHHIHRMLRQQPTPNRTNHTDPTGPPTTSPAPSATITAGRASASMNPTRPAGYPGSTGTYAAPAFTTPSNAVTSPIEPPITTATTRSGPAPYAASRPASRPAAASSSP